MDDKYRAYRRISLGYAADPPAKVHTRIIFGPGIFLTKSFCEKHKITHVINCAFEEDCPTWFKNEYSKNYVCVSAEDGLDKNILEWYPAFEKSMASFLKSKDCKVVYVHCKAGINRSGFLTLLFLCLHFGYNYTESIKCIIRQRPCALQNPTYQIQVEKRCCKE